MSFFVIPNYVRNKRHNSWMLAQCLKGVATFEPRARVVVVDDGSPVEDVKEHYRPFEEVFGVHVSYMGQNSGYSAAINRGLWLAARAGAEMACTLNNDVEIMTQVFARPLSLLQQMPRLGVVGAKLYFPSGQIQHAGVDVARNGQVQLLDRGLIDVVNSGDSNRPKFVPVVTGALQIINMAMVKEVGEYSEEYRMAYEDAEFCMRAWNKGWWCLYDPYIEGVHYEGATRGSGLTPTEMASLKRFGEDLGAMDYWEIRQEIDSANALLDGMR